MKLLKVLFALTTTTALAVNSSLQSTDAKLLTRANAPRNYMLNGHFEKNEAGVTDASSIAARVTTTPLEGVGELNINATATAQIVYLEADAIQPGLEGQSCEASFVYTGDASLYTAYVYGAAKLSDTVTLQNVGTKSQTVSLIFPCYPASSGGAFVAIESIGDGASINIDSVYLGKALGIGTVAQAEAVVSASRVATQTISATTATKVQLTTVNYDVNGEFDNATNYRFTAKRIGKYGIKFDAALASVSAERYVLTVYKNGAATCNTSYNPDAAGLTYYPSGSCDLDLVVGDYIELFIDSQADASYTITANLYISRFPGQSEIVVRGNITNIAVEASGTPTGSLSAASATIWGTETRDTAAAYNSTTGEFTTPLPGDYCYNAAVGVSATYTAGNILAVIPYINGVAVVGDGLFRFVGASTNSVQAQANGCTFLNRGDILTFRTTTTGTTPTFVAANTNYLKIYNASGGVPKPFIPGSVYGGRSAVAKTGIAVLNCTTSSTIGNNFDGMIATIGNRSTATCAFTFAANFWSQAPDCVVSSATSAARVVAVTSVTTSGGNVLGYTDAGVGDNTTINMFCMGQ